MRYREQRETRKTRGAQSAGAILALSLLLQVVAGWLAGAPVTATELAAAPATSPFARTWARTDKPVADLRANRTWMWGPEAFTELIQEEYADSPDGRRAVQYFDKSRMEITNPNAVDDGLWYVTNGLLVKELITGRMQVGDNAYIDRQPALVNIAGDPGTGPTYAALQPLLDDPALAAGMAITARLSADGSVTQDDSLAARGVQAVAYVPDTNHTVAGPFWEFMNSQGVVSEDGAYVTADLFIDPFYATGFPITEAYWTAVTVGGTAKDVLFQCFQRRCLTYTPDNPAGWQVEAGNVGRHYYQWRYADTPPAPASVSAAAIDPSTVVLAWTDTSDTEDGFRIYDGYAPIADVPANQTTHRVEGLAAGSYHCYTMTAFNASGESPHSGLGCIRTPAGPGIQPPAAPTNFVAQAVTSSTIALSWSDSSDNEAGFTVRNGGGRIWSLDPNVEQIVIDGYSAGDYDCFMVSAHNEGGEAAYTDPVTADPWKCALTPAASIVPVPPLAPTNLAAHATDPTTITLTWSDNSSDEDGFRIYEGATLVSQVAAGQTSFTVTQLAPGSNHCYTVSAFRGELESERSTEDCAQTPDALPAAPSNLSAEVLDRGPGKKVRLSWSDNSTNEEGFRIYRNNAQIASPGAGETSYTDNHVDDDDAPYCYTVTAVNSTGESPHSNEVCVTLDGDDDD